MSPGDLPPLPETVTFPEPVAAPGDQAFVQYSLETTGLKKGVSITHATLLYHVDSYAREIKLGPDDAIVSWLPLYHDMGLIACYWLPILKGVPVTALSPFEWVRRPHALLRAASDYGSTHCWLPNFAYRHIASTEVAVSEVRLFEHMWLAKSSSGKIARAANLERYRAPEAGGHHSRGRGLASGRREPGGAPRERA